MAQRQDVVSFKQRKALEYLCDPEWSGTITKLCEDVEITRKTYYEWMQKPVFLKALNEHIDRYSESMLPEAWKALQKKIAQGDTSAIKLYMEVKGKYKLNVNMSGSVVFLEGDDKIAE